MRNGIIGRGIIVLIFAMIFSIANGQTTIFSETFNEANGSTSGLSAEFVGWNATCPGCAGTFEVESGVLVQNQSRVVTTFLTNPINVSNCNTITFRARYTGTMYGASGDVLDSATKCGCAGDVNDSGAGGCFNCWDFFLAELVFDGTYVEEAEFIGTSKLVDMSNIDYTTACVGNYGNVQIKIRSQTWGSTEFMRVDNIVLICNDPPNDLDVDQVPIGPPEFCDGDPVTLEVRNAPGESYQWFNPNGNPIGTNSTTLNFTASTAFGAGLPAQQYKLISINGLGCKSTGGRAIIVNPSPSATLPATITACQGDNISIPETGGDGTSWIWSGPGPSNPGNNPTWNINNAQLSASGTYSVTVTSAGCSKIASTTVNINPAGPFALTPVLALCENDVAQPLSTTQSGINGNWSGMGVTSNSFDPKSVGAGIYSITFTPSSAGCLIPQSTDVNVNGSPSSSVPSSPIESCGVGTASFDLTTLDSEVNGGGGETVIWYEQANQVDEIIDPSAYSAFSSTVYAVVSDGTCFSNQQLLDLLVTDGPEIMMSPSIEGCEDITINNITILNETGNQAYYDMPGGMGNQYLPGHVFTDDITIYAYDENGACSDEQEIILTVGKMTDAGPDLSIVSCVAGLINLQGLVDSSADPGRFLDEMGNPVANMLDPGTLTNNSITLTFSTSPLGICPSDEATYMIGLFSGNDAGADSKSVICSNETIDINTLTVDNGVSGYFIFTDGTVNPVEVITMLPGDSPFQLDFYYIVDVLGSCTPDSALIVVEGLDEKTTSIAGMFCPDYEIEVFGVMYNHSNETGMEMGLSSTGCDSTVNIDLVFRNENRFFINDVLCIGNDITVNSVVYNEFNPQGEERLVGMDQFGCDSIVEIDLTFDTEVTSLLNFTLCAGQDTLINGKLYSDADATGSASLLSSTGCDSIVNVDLKFAQSSELLISQLLCPHEDLVIENEVFNSGRLSGMFLSQSLNANGCDSMILVDLTIDNSFSKLFDLTICSDENIDINNKTYSAANPSGIDTITNMGSCDSLYIIDLNILKADTTFIQGSFCNDTSFVVNGNTYNQSNVQGMEMISGGAASGCNEYIFIDIEYIESIEVDLNEVLCLNDSLIINSVVYNSVKPIGQEMLLTSNGCDSIVNVNLTFEGMDVGIIYSRPDCDYASLGELELDIYEGEEFLSDILLNGVSVLAEYQNNTRLLNLLPGDYEVEFIDIRGCSELKNFTIYNFSFSTLSVSANVVNESFYKITTNFTGEIESIKWTPSEGLSCVDCENPEAIPPGRMTYIVDIEDENGCTFQDSVTLEFLINSLLYKPNIFSPNDDGVNDVFFIDSDEAFEFSAFAIFDRWGNMIFKEQNGVTGDSSLGWDGNQNNQGVYIYTMTVEFPDGPQTIIGEFSLIR